MAIFKNKFKRKQERFYSVASTEPYKSKSMFCCRMKQPFRSKPCTAPINQMMTSKVTVEHEVVLTQACHGPSCLVSSSAFEEVLTLACVEPAVQLCSWWWSMRRGADLAFRGSSCPAPRFIRRCRVTIRFELGPILLCVIKGTTTTKI